MAGAGSKTEDEVEGVRNSATLSLMLDVKPLPLVLPAALWHMVPCVSALG